MTLEYADMRDDAFVRVVLGIEDEGAEWAVLVTLRGRDALDQRFEDLGDSGAFLGTGEDDLVGVEADDTLQFRRNALGLGVGEVDLVQDGDELEVLVHGEVDVRERLRLDALGGVDHQEGAFAGGQAAGNFVGEVDVAGGIDQVEFVLDAIARGIAHAGGGGFDGDALFALEVHGVEQLLRHVALGDGARGFEEAVGQGRLAVVDVRDDAEVADAGLVHVLSVVGA